MKEFISWNVVDECVTDIAEHLIRNGTWTNRSGRTNGSTTNVNAVLIDGKQYDWSEWMKWPGYTSWMPRS